MADFVSLALDGVWIEPFGPYPRETWFDQSQRLTRCW